MSDADLDQLLDDDMETKYSPLEDIKSFKCLEYELTVVPKLLKLGLIEDTEVEDKKIYIQTLKEALDNQLKGGKISYPEALQGSLELNENLLKELMRNQYDLDMEDGAALYDFYNSRILKRISLIKQEITSNKEEEKEAPEDNPSESWEPSADSEMAFEEEHQIVEPTLNKVNSKAQKEFDSNLRRAQTQGSVVLEEYDYSDIKKVLRERLINYEMAINYCGQIGQKEDIINDLKEKADLIKHFISKYKHQNEDDYLQLIVKLPRDVVPQDIFGNQRKGEFLKYIEYIEKLIPQIQKERNKMMSIYKAQKDPISKENLQKLIKLVKEQEDIKEKLLVLLGNKWQPVPEIHISEVHFPTLIGSVKSGKTIEVNVTLPKSYSKTFFRYYLLIRLNDFRDETIDRRDLPILGTSFKVEFDLDEAEDRKKISSYKIEVELYQYRLKIFDSLQEYTTIELKRFRSLK